MITNKKTPISDIILKTLIYLSTAITLSISIGLLLYILVQGVPSITWELVSTQSSELYGTVGILPNIINTLYIIVITLIFSVPIGIGAAIYLNEYAKKGPFVTLIETTTETLAGIPSIIYGLFGFMFFNTFMGFQYSIISGALTLAIMVLPTIIRTTQEALKSVPDSYREGALGMGANKYNLVFTILVPCAMPGIITAVILSIGRIVGESAALIFTAGMGYSMPSGWFDHIFSSGATLTVQLYQYAVRGENLDVCFAIASVLIILVIIINFSAKSFSKKLTKK